MIPAYYVVRLPDGSPARRRISLILESRPFSRRHRAEDWRDFIASEHPKDDVYVVQLQELTDSA